MIGKVKLSMNKGKKVEHQGVRLELIGFVGNFFEIIT